MPVNTRVAAGAPVFQNQFAGLGDREYFENGLNSLIFESHSRALAGTNNAAQGSGVMFGALIWIPAGITLSKIAFMSGTTPATGPTNWWHAMYDPSLNLLCTTNDQLTAAWVANSYKELAITKNAAGGTISSITTAVTGWYVVASMIAAGTPPTMRGNTFGTAGIGAGLSAGQVSLSQTSGSGLTVLPPPATWASAANVAPQPYCLVRP